MSKKKKILLIVIAILMLIVLITAGYTFSKYYQEINGSASTQIAAWSFKANAGNDKASITDIVLKSGSEEKIAPGSSGNFQIKVDALGSDVDVKYSVKVSKEKLPSNMIFYIEGNKETKYTSLADLAETELNGTLTTSSSQTKTYTIGWEWPFNSYNPVDNSLLDTKDVADGMSTESYGFEVEIIGEQVEK